MAEMFVLPDKPVSFMSEDEMIQMKAWLESQLRAMDAEEPADEQSEAYEDWADRHEDLEDQLDEVLDLLEG